MLNTLYSFKNYWTLFWNSATLLEKALILKKLACKLHLQIKQNRWLSWRQHPAEDFTCILCLEVFPFWLSYIWCIFSPPWALRTFLPVSSTFPDLIFIYAVHVSVLFSIQQRVESNTMDFQGPLCNFLLSGALCHLWVYVSSESRVLNPAEPLVILSVPPPCTTAWKLQAVSLANYMVHLICFPLPWI